MHICVYGIVALAVTGLVGCVFVAFIGAGSKPNNSVLSINTKLKVVSNPLSSRVFIGAVPVDIEMNIGLLEPFNEGSAEYIHAVQMNMGLHRWGHYCGRDIILRAAKWWKIGVRIVGEMQSGDYLSFKRWTMTGVGENCLYFGRGHRRQIYTGIFDYYPRSLLIPHFPQSIGSRISSTLSSLSGFLIGIPDGNCGDGVDDKNEESKTLKAKGSLVYPITLCVAG